MRWFAYFILAYLVLGMQAGLGAFLEYRGATPNLVLLAALFIATHAPRDAALLGCFGMGLMQDMLTAQPLGVYALAYGIVGLMITSSQSAMEQEHILANMVIALVAAAVVALVVWLNMVLAPRLSGAAPAAGGSVVSLMLGVLYTTLLAPLVSWPLQRIKKRFAFERSRRAW
jgi:rod shape-determining protein MreD